MSLPAPSRLDWVHRPRLLQSRVGATGGEVTVGPQVTTAQVREVFVPWAVREGE